METNPEDVATWLARETGHMPETEEGYEKDDDDDEGPRKIGLPQDKHERLRKFFDGIHMEKAMTQRRREEQLNMVDEAEMMNQALKSAVPQAPQTPPGGGY